MYRMGQQYAAELGLSPVPAMASRNIHGCASRLSRRSPNKVPGEAEAYDPFGLLQSIAKTALKDRHHSADRCFLGVNDAVYVGERAGKGLFADDFLAGFQCRERLRNMQRRRRADVDNIDILHA